MFVLGIVKLVRNIVHWVAVMMIVLCRASLGIHMQLKSSLVIARIELPFGNELIERRRRRKKKYGFIFLHKNLQWQPCHYINRCREAMQSAPPARVHAAESCRPKRRPTCH